MQPIDRVITALKKKEKEERNRLAEQEAAQQLSQNGGINADMITNFNVRIVLIDNNKMLHGISITLWQYNKVKQPSNNCGVNVKT